MKRVAAVVFILAVLCIWNCLATAEDTDKQLRRSFCSPIRNNDKCDRYCKDRGYEGGFKYSPEVSSSFDADDTDNSNLDGYDGALNSLGYGLNENEKRASKAIVYRRGCIPRKGVCDNHRNECCYNSSCRCNFWGTNCRCQRMGLFQKWG